MFGLRGQDFDSETSQRDENRFPLDACCVSVKTNSSNSDVCDYRNRLDSQQILQQSTRIIIDYRSTTDHVNTTTLLS